MRLISQITNVILCIGIAVALLSCSGSKGSSTTKQLADQTDSLSYVIGMNIAYNIMKMDSTIRPEAVIKGLDDALNGKELLTIEDARTYFLAYMNYDVYERVRKYEEQYLSDLVAGDNKVVRTRTGLTYKVEELGDMNNTLSNDRDTVAITYRASRISGEEVDLATNRDDTLRVVVNKLIPGLREGVKLVGQGGKLTLWVPSSLAYGSIGNNEKGIKPNELLRYEVNIVEVKRRRR
ncbi:MAG: FKBP-type peptidyl-prolyl cis-trans isomerase [Alistipes sp.]|nr:FKBP-type peptidyl-prolyl cis-trans isomerase [Alistipes sp.]